MNIYSTQHVPCPNCQDNVFDEENCESLAFEPFNGIVANCPECGAELSLDMKVSVEYTSQPPTFKK